MNIGDLIFSLLADGSKLEKSVTDQATSAADAAGGKAGTTLGQRIATNAGKGMAALGAAGGAIFAGAVEAGATFEDQLRTINTVAKLSDDQLAKVGDDIQGLSRETGKTTDDLTSGFYDLVSAGVPADKAMQALKDSAVLATGALGTTGEAVDLVTSALGAYNMDASQSTRVTDIFAQAVADGKTTVADLAGGISQVAPIAAAAGISLEEVAAQTAIMTLKGDTASQAMTRIKNAISALLTPNAELADISKRTGINFAELAKDKGLAVALDTLRKATNGDNESFAKALGSSEALTLAFATTGDNAGAMAIELGKVKDGADKGGVALGQYTEKSKSGVEQSKRFSAWLNTLAQDFGGVFSAAGPLLLTLNGLAPALRGLISPAKLAGAAIGGIGGRLIGSLAGALSRAEIGTRLETLGLWAQTQWIKGLTKGDRVGDAVGDAIFRIQGNSKVSAASEGLGKFMGSKLGMAFSVAFAAVAIVELGKTFIEIKGQLDAQASDLTKQTSNFITTATSAQLKAQLEVVEEAKRRLSVLASLPGAGIAVAPLVAGQVDELNRQIDLLKGKIDAIDNSVSDVTTTTGAAMGALGEHAAAEAATGVTTGAPEVAKATVTMVDAATYAGIQAAAKASYKLGQAIPDNTAAGLLSRQQSVHDAFHTFLDTMMHALSPAKEQARLLGNLTSKKLREGLESGNPIIRKAAEETQTLILNRLEELVRQGKPLGADAARAVANGLRSRNPQMRAQAELLAKFLPNALDDQKGPANKKGANLGAAAANGLKSGFGHPVLTADIHVRGSSNDKGKAVGGPVFGETPYWVNEHTANSEMFVPSGSGRILTHAQAVQAISESAGGGGDTYNIPVQVTGVLAARKPDDVARPLRQLAAAGVLTSPRDRQRVQVPTHG